MRPQRTAPKETEEKRSIIQRVSGWAPPRRTTGKMAAKTRLASAVVQRWAVFRDEEE
jgi:hypothetical protein